MLNMQEVRSQLEDLGLDAEPSDPATFLARIKADHAMWAKLVRQAGITGGGD